MAIGPFLFAGPIRSWRRRRRASGLTLREIAEMAERIDRCDGAAASSCCVLAGRIVCDRSEN